MTATEAPPITAITSTSEEIPFTIELLPQPQPRNVALFDKIADKIEANPDCYDQRFWSIAPRTDPRFDTGLSPDVFVGRSVWCRCIGGHACALSGEVRTDPVRALHHLGLTEAEGTILFNGAWKPSTGETVPQWLRAFARGDRQL